MRNCRISPPTSKQTVLIHPIITDNENQVIDGRNRLAACKIAKVEPTFEKLNGQDPLAYIVSANLARRNLSKGQQAMGLAMIYPEPEKGGRGKRSQFRESLSRTQENRLSQARSVLRYSKPLAGDVMSGKAALNEAIEIVYQQTQIATSKEAQIERLRKEATDLADLVDEERMKLSEAFTVLGERNTATERVREGGRHAAAELKFLYGRIVCIEQAMKSGEKKLLTQEIVDKVMESAKYVQKLFKEQSG